MTLKNLEKNSNHIVKVNMMLKMKNGVKEHHGRYLYYPKYGTSYYDSQEYRKQMY